MVASFNLNARTKVKSLHEIAGLYVREHAGGFEVTETAEGRP